MEPTIDLARVREVLNIAGAGSVELPWSLSMGLDIKELLPNLLGVRGGASLFFLAAGGERIVGQIQAASPGGILVTRVHRWNGTDTYGVNRSTVPIFILPAVWSNIPAVPTGNGQTQSIIEVNRLAQVGVPNGSPLYNDETVDLQFYIPAGEFFHFSGSNNQTGGLTIEWVEYQSLNPEAD